MDPIGPCKYCGQETERLDVYGELECSNCDRFFSAHPNPPVAPPSGATVVNLNLLKPKESQNNG